MKTFTYNENSVSYLGCVTSNGEIVLYHEEKQRIELRKTGDIGDFTEISLKTFVLDRLVNTFGIGGLGIICQGWILPDTRVILEWLGENRSVVIHESIEKIQKIHCYNDTTRIVYDK